MADPYKKQVADAIWALLEGRPAFVTPFAVANRVRDTQVGWLRKAYHQRSGLPGDKLQVQLTNGRFTNSGYNLPAQPTYAMERGTYPNATDDWPVRRRCEFVLTLTAADTAADVLDVAEEEAQNALLLAGPRLGLPAFVLQWGPLDARQTLTKFPPSDVVRRVSTISIPVLMEFSGHDLRAALLAP